MVENRGGEINREAMASATLCPPNLLNSTRVNRFGEWVETARAKKAGQYCLGPVGL